MSKISDIPLNLPKYSFNIKTEDDQELIWDDIRRKHIILTPEEWVRQNFISYLIKEKGYPPSHISIEKEISVNKNKRRFDALIYNADMHANLIIEFKSSKVEINQMVFEQIAQYNISCKVEYLIVSNGIRHFCCIIDIKNKSYKFTDTIPNYTEI